MTSRKNRILIYALAAVLGVVAVMVVQRTRDHGSAGAPAAASEAAAEANTSEASDAAEASAASAAQAASAAAPTAAAPNPFPAGSPAHAAFDTFMAKLQADPKFRALASHASSSTSYDRGFTLTQSGLVTLPDAVLEKRLALMAKVVAAMPDADCQTSSRARVDALAKQRILSAAIARLDAGDANAWFDFSWQAAQAALNGKPAIAANRDTVAAALKKIVANVPNTDQSRFLAAIRSPDSVTPQASCWATRTLYREASSLDEPYRAAMARGLVEPTN